MFRKHDPEVRVESLMFFFFPHVALTENPTVKTAIASAEPYHKICRGESHPGPPHKRPNLPNVSLTLHFEHPTNDDPYPKERPPQ